MLPRRIFCSGLVEIRSADGESRLSDFCGASIAAVLHPRNEPLRDIRRRWRYAAGRQFNQRDLRSFESFVAKRNGDQRSCEQFRRCCLPWQECCESGLSDGGSGEGQRIGLVAQFKLDVCLRASPIDFLPNAE